MDQQEFYEGLLSPQEKNAQWADQAEHYVRLKKLAADRSYKPTPAVAQEKTASVKGNAVNDWLVKLAAKNTNAQQLQAALADLPFEEIEKLAHEAHVADDNKHYHQFLEKAAAADQMGRELAHKHGGSLFTQVTGQEKLAGLMSAVAQPAMTLGQKVVGGGMKALVKNPAKALGVAGAVAGAGIGAAAGGEGNRLGGALGGAAIGGGLGAAGGALGAGKALSKGILGNSQYARTALGRTGMADYTAAQGIKGVAGQQAARQAALPAVSAGTGPKGAAQLGNAPGTPAASGTTVRQRTGRNTPDPMAQERMRMQGRPGETDKAYFDRQMAR